MGLQIQNHGGVRAAELVPSNSVLFREHQITPTEDGSETSKIECRWQSIDGRQEHTCQIAINRQNHLFNDI